MLASLGAHVVRFRWWIIAFWCAVFVVSVPFAFQATSSLKSGFGEVETESRIALRLMSERLELPESSVTLVFSSDSLDASDPRYVEAVERATAPLSQIPQVDRLITFNSADNNRMIAPDGRTTYAFVLLDADIDAATDLVPDIRDALLPGDDLDIWVTGGVAIFSDGQTIQRVPLDSGNGISSHDRDNVLAALTAVWALGVDPNTASQALADFQALPHRCEVVSSRGGLTWVNDSKATNPGAAQRAIEGSKAPILWIAGGRGKALAFEDLAQTARGRVKVALLIGEAAHEIEEALGGHVRFEHCSDLDAAVAMAASLGEPGDVVLLAPACASFDQFKSFEHRGDSFRNAVQRLAGEDPS